MLDIEINRRSVVPVARMLNERGVPFLFQTGQPDLARLRSAWPASPVLAKPVPARDLVRAMARLLGRLP